MSLYAKPCPFCGKRPEVIPYPNGKGAEVQCSNKECGNWPYKFDLLEWNRRKEPNKEHINKDTVNKLLPLLFYNYPVYYPRKSKEIMLYCCCSCGAEGENMQGIKHRKNCAVSKLINASR